ncbi:hypothetical protein ACLMJK_002318 [Lecanora helva]
MPVTTDIDGSEDVNDFLLRIRELGDQRDKEDEERTRKLEEEILQGRRERQARRAGTPGSAKSNKDMDTMEHLSRAPSLQPKSPDALNRDDDPRKTNRPVTVSTSSGLAEKPRRLPELPSKPKGLASISPSASLPPARAGTLSWQQRPSTRSTGSKTRPMSMQNFEDEAAKAPPRDVEPESEMDGSLSRSQIAQSLGSQDPMWFRQTQERGVRSGALRKNQEEQSSDTASTTSSVRLPGMSREGTADLESRISPPPDSIGSKDSLRQGHRYSGSASISSERGIRSPLPTIASQRFEPPSSDTISTSGDDASSTARSLAMSPSQGRISPERIDRSASPTKGLGGFVQSAMLKRSDSVNKRWNTQAGPGLSRGNSTTSNLSSYASSKYPLGNFNPLAESRPNSVSRESSPYSTSRPNSSHTNTTNLGPIQRLSENDKPSTSAFLNGSPPETRSDSPLTKPTPQESTLSAPSEAVISPPQSPSKRWSPTKSSWLENAINKNDSPKIKSPVPQQPAWMAEINRAKQKKGSTDLGKELKFKEVAIGGLIRSPPPVGEHNQRNTVSHPSNLSTSVVTESRNGTTTEEGKIEESSSSTRPKVITPAVTPKPDALTAADPATTPSVRTPTRQMDGLSVTSGSPKAKPETPPKKELSLAPKAGRIPRETKGSVEPEFKNVFGNLKRTQTKNYVAPDELKDNIMRGKAGLATTRGPKKTVQRDEFRESILQKKQGMVAPSASTKITSASSKTQDQSTPEALAKRRALIQSDSSVNNSAVKVDHQPSKPKASENLRQVREKPKSSVPERQRPELNDNRSLSPPTEISGSNFTASLAGILQRGPSPIAAKSPSSTFNVENRDSSREVGEPSVASERSQLTHATKARARGPKRRLPTASKQDQSVDIAQSNQDAQSKSLASERKASVTVNGSMPQSNTVRPTGNGKPESRPLADLTLNNNNNRKPSPRKPSTNVAAPSETVSDTTPTAHVITKEAQAHSSPSANQKPDPSPKVPETHQIARPTPTTLPDTPRRLGNTEEPFSHTSKPAKQRQADDSQPEITDTPLPSVKDAAAIWDRSSKINPPNRARSPVKLPTRDDEEAALEQAGLKPKRITEDDTKALNSAPPASTDSAAHAALSAKSPPTPSKKSSSITSRVVSTSNNQLATTQSIQPPSGQTTQVIGLLSDIFDDPLRSTHGVKINTQSVLDTCSSKASSTKIKTLRKQIAEIENGKSVPIPMHQEHVLFDHKVYLCTHVFGNETGQRTAEVYLWHGDAAPAPIVEDAQLFARKHAKENGAKLVTLKQGKELSNFFQALGGIVITRRSSSAKAGFGDKYILCGRQHIGQVAFDEVEYDARSLCQGFPYIICTQSGKLYLWKGSGSSADELGCARLIGMDLGNSGDIEEVDEGCEPDAFWREFSRKPQDKTEVSRAIDSHWHLKSSCENYVTRLFGVSIETQRPKSASGFMQGAMQWSRRGSAPSNDGDAAKTALIREILPFAQSDLETEGVFVLDAFFELFVILTIRTFTPAPHQKSTETLAFRAGLLFAQEYGILAASEEDRPRVPTASVVICSKNATDKDKQSLPEMMVRAFRKWDEGFVNECRIVPLTAALEAMGEQR